MSRSVKQSYPPKRTEQTMTVTRVPLTPEEAEVYLGGQHYRVTVAPKRVITLPDEKIVFKPGQGFVVEEHEDRDTLSEQS